MYERMSLIFEVNHISLRGHLEVGDDVVPGRRGSFSCRFHWWALALLQRQALPGIKPAAQVQKRFGYRLVARLLHHWLAYLALDMLWRSRMIQAHIIPPTNINPVMSRGSQYHFPLQVADSQGQSLIRITILAGENPLIVIINHHFGWWKSPFVSSFLSDDLKGVNTSSASTGARNGALGGACGRIAGHGAPNLLDDGAAGGRRVGDPAGAGGSGARMCQVLVLLLFKTCC